MHRMGRGVFPRLLLTATLLLPCLSASAAMATDSAVVVMYHRFGESEYPSTNIPLAQFDAHLAELKNGRYTVLPLSEIVAAIRARTPLPDRTVGLSIDDAYLSVYTQAWPRLKKAGFPFTLFIATDSVDRNSPQYMSWDQVRELARAGVTIGSQTASHPHMAKTSAERNREEIRRSNARFEQEIGAKPDLFAYPYGESSLLVAKVVAEEGFSVAFGQHSGAFDATSDMLFLPRFAMNESYGDMERFRLAANALALPVTDLAPPDHLVGENNPPAIGFSVAPSVPDISRLSCFASHVVGRIRVEHLGSNRVEIRLGKALPAGRTRFSCSMPEGNGRWYWLGRQFYVPD